jgi:uncharacterized protein YutE (UPF0331/DUF86 family)
MSVISDKISEVESYLSELESVVPETLEDYLKNLEKRLACERAFEKIMESVNDLAILVIKQKRLQLPSEDVKAFEVLSDKRIISQELSTNLKKAKGMRNFLAHQYGKVDDELVFEAIHKEVFDDVNNFLTQIEKI